VRAAFDAHLKPGAAALGVRELREALYLPFTSPTSPHDLPYISPTSPQYLAYISQVRELREALRDAGVACASEVALEILHRRAADGEGKLDLAEFGALVTECLP
jgi:hypothetical protein